MKLLIIGLGSFGSALARRLTEKNVEVHGIDLNPTRVRKNSFIAKIFQIDACIRDELMNLQLKQYDKVLICMGRKFEKSNLMASIHLQQLNESEIIVQYLSEIQKKSLEGLGIDNFINPSEMSLTEIIQDILA